MAPNHIQKGLYVHSASGDLYWVIGLGTHEITGEMLVIYHPVSDPLLISARPLDNFIEPVEVGDSVKPRFVRFWKKRFEVVSK